MAVQDYFTAEQLEAQAALDRSHAAGQAIIADPVARQQMVDALADLDSRPPAPPMTGVEFLSSVGLEHLIAG